MTQTPKTMTLQECKDEVARKYNYSAWDMIIVEHVASLSAPDQLDILNEAAELYKTSALTAYKEELRGKIEAEMVTTELENLLDSYRFFENSDQETIDRIRIIFREQI